MDTQIYHRREIGVGGQVCWGEAWFGVATKNRTVLP